MADYALSNRVDETYMLMTLVPILPELSGKWPSPTARIRGFLSRLPNGEESPFLKIPSLHFCRFVVVADLPSEGYPATSDHLQSPYLLMSASIAGDWKTSVKSMVSELPDVISSIFENCVAYPGSLDAMAFVNYLEKCQIDAAFAFGAYPQASLYEVKRALDVQQKMRQFVIDNQQSTPEVLKEEFQAFIRNLGSGQ